MVYGGGCLGGLWGLVVLGVWASSLGCFGIVVWCGVLGGGWALVLLVGLV